jgi:alkylation response protein AidB-like acyl-CoA dehydrogenase
VEFTLDDEQLALQSAVRDLIEAHSGLPVVRAIIDDAEGDGEPAGLWERMAGQGWPALLIPEADGGLGLGLLDAAVVARCLGAGVVPGPFAASLIGGEAVRLCGSAQQRDQWLTQLAQGRVRFSVALLRPGCAWDQPGDAISATADRLTGELTHVDYAHVADRIVVAARRENDETGLWLVDPAGAGVTITRTRTLDATTATAAVTLRDAAAEPLPEASQEAVIDLLSRATVLAANDLAGIAREALTRTVAYLKTREQFGRPIGSFQALKHHLATQLVALTMAEHACWYAAHALDEALPDAAASVSIAKAKASDVARALTSTMIQYHGGIGFTWEHDTHIFFKRARRLEHAYGDAGQHRDRLATLVLG